MAEGHFLRSDALSEMGVIGGTRRCVSGLSVLGSTEDTTALPCADAAMPASASFGSSGKCQWSTTAHAALSSTRSCDACRSA